VGEVLDIVYIKPTVFKKDLKSSEKMHILDFAVKTNQPLDYADYLKMFATSTVRISLAVRLPPNIDDLDPGTQKIHFQRGQKELKMHFSIDTLTAWDHSHTTTYTLRDAIHQTNDIDDIRETFGQSPVPMLITEARETLAGIKNTVKAIKQMSVDARQEITDSVMEELEALDPEGLVYTMIRGSIYRDELLKCVSSQSDSRALFVIKTIETSLCNRLQDLPERDIRRFIILYALVKVLEGKSANSNTLISKMF